jgi:hypothetical protein
MLPDLPLDLMMFAALIGAILLGYPVAFTIAGVAVLFAFAGWWLDIFGLNLLGALGQRFFAIMTNPVLTAIPLFVLMGVVLEKSRIAEDLLEIVGEGPERPRLEGLIRSLGLNGRVTLSGAQPDPWDRVARADAFFLPSRHEGMPNVVLESLCLGTPVIATDELEVLTSLRTKCPSGAVTLVERSELAAAIGSVRPTPVGAPIPRPSLLPPTNRVGAVVARLLELIASLASP